MTKRERVMAAIKGEEVDKVPASFWGHNHLAERSAEALAPYLLEQNRKFDWDFIKVNLSYTSFVEPWGSKYRFDAEKGPQLEDYPVKNVNDLRKLERLDPTKGMLADQVKVSKYLAEAVKREVPIVHTIFSPLSVVARLCGGIAKTPTEASAVQKFMVENPEGLIEGLQTITSTLVDYAREVIRAGADGIFFATTVWSGDTLTKEQFEIFGKPYDLVIYKAAAEEGATFNMSHLCRENIMLEDMTAGFPTHVISYDSLSPRNPSLKEAMSRTDKALCSGVRGATLLNGPVEAISAEVRATLEATGGRRLILGPDCVVPPNTPDKHLLAVNKLLESLNLNRSVFVKDKFPNNVQIM